MVEASNGPRDRTLRRISLENPRFVHFPVPSLAAAGTYTEAAWEIVPLRGAATYEESQLESDGRGGAGQRSFAGLGRSERARQGQRQGPARFAGFLYQSDSPRRLARRRHGPVPRRDAADDVVPGRKGRAEEHPLGSQAPVLFV